MELPYASAILVLGIYLKKVKTLTQRKDIYITMFIAALFTITKIWKQSKCPSTDEWIKKYIYNIYMCVCIYMYICNGILFSHEKE